MNEERTEQNRPMQATHSEAAKPSSGERFPASTFTTAATGDPYEYGSLFLCLDGRITFCSASLARLIGCEESQIAGLPIRYLMKDLPIRDRTPGYNLAASLLLYGSRWEPQRLSLRDGSGLEVQVSMHSLDMGREPPLLLHVRWPAGAVPKRRRI